MPIRIEPPDLERRLVEIERSLEKGSTTGRIEGQGTVEWPGGKNQSNVTVVFTTANTAHYFLQPVWVGRIWFVGVLNPTTLSFEAQAYCPTELPAAGTKEKFRFVCWQKE